MTPFEKAAINELQGIKKELHELNRKKQEQGQVDGVIPKVNISIPGLNGVIDSAKASYKASIERGY